MARTRTNIEIDDDLVANVMRRYGLKTKTAAVEVALRRVAITPMTRDEALAMEGAQYIDDVDTEGPSHW